MGERYCYACGSTGIVEDVECVECGCVHRMPAPNNALRAENAALKEALAASAAELLSEAKARQQGERAAYERCMSIEQPDEEIPDWAWTTADPYGSGWCAGWHAHVEAIRKLAEDAANA